MCFGGEGDGMESKTVGTLAGNLCVCQLEDISGQIAFESVVVKRCNLSRDIL